MKRVFFLLLAFIAVMVFFKENRSLEDASEVLWEQAGQEGSYVAVLIGQVGDESYC